MVEPHFHKATSPRRRIVKRVFEIKFASANNGDDADGAADTGTAEVSRPSLRNSHRRMPSRSLDSGAEARR